MNRIYDVGNKAKTGLFIAAPNEATAKNIALKLGHVKSIDHARASDLTDILATEKGIAEIVASEKAGHIVLELVAYSIHEVFAGVKKEPKGWRFA